MRMKVNAFERWCYRMILGISWRDKVSTPKAVERVQIEFQTDRVAFHKGHDKEENEICGTCAEGLE